MGQDKTNDEAVENGGIKFYVIESMSSALPILSLFRFIPTVDTVGYNQIAIFDGFC